MDIHKIAVMLVTKFDTDNFIDDCTINYDVNGNTIHFIFKDFNENHYIEDIYSHSYQKYEYDIDDAISLIEEDIEWTLDDLGLTDKIKYEIKNEYCDLLIECYDMNPSNYNEGDSNEEGTLEFDLIIKEVLEK